MTTAQWAGLSVASCGGFALLVWGVYRFVHQPGTRVASPGAQVPAAAAPVYGSMNLAEERALHTDTVAWGLPDDGGWASGGCWPDGGGDAGYPDDPYLTDDQWLASLHDPGVGAEWSPAVPAPAPCQHCGSPFLVHELDCPQHTGSRLADTGDVASARLLAEISASLRAQDDDTAAWLSKFRQDCQQARLDLTGALA